MNFTEELKILINKRCLEYGSNTPDFILAVFLQKCLSAFELAVNDRDNWYGVHLEPGNITFIGDTCDPESER